MTISILFLFAMPITCIYYTYQLNTEIKAYNSKIKEIDEQTKSVKNELEIINKELNQEHLSKLQELSFNGIFNINKLGIW